MQNQFTRRPIEILLVEDNAGDVRLTVEAFRDAKVRNNMAVVRDGVEAMQYLRQEGEFSDNERPDVILLDLNLPRMDGREVLAKLKKDPSLKNIPVVILTTSEAESDILQAYELHANCYITKPVDLEQFVTVVKSIEEFWFEIVKLPSSQ